MAHQASPASASPGVGLLLLPATKVRGAGSMSDPDEHHGPVTELAVRDQPLARIIAGEASADYVDAAGRLAADGASLIASNCGLSGLYQTDIQKATGLPTVTTSLMLAPLVLSVFGGPIAIVAFGSDDAPRHLERMFPGQGVVEQSRIVSIKGRPGLEWLGSPDALVPDWDAARLSFEQNIVPEIIATGAKAVLLECTAVLPVADVIRRASGLPTVTVNGFLRYIQSEVLGWGRE